MKDCNCGYCVGGEPLAKFGIKICDLKVSQLILFKEQSHPGRVIVAYKDHVSELVALKKAFVYPKDAYSLKDKMGDLMDNPETAKILAAAMQGMSSSPLMSSMGTMSEEMMGFMRNARLNDLLKMAGDSISMKDKLALNQALNAIKK